MMRLLLLLFITGLLSGCSGKAVEKYTMNMGTKYAKHFRLVAHAGYMEVQLLQPETGKPEKSFALVRRTSTVSVPASMTRIDVPVKNMAALSTTHIGMLSALGGLQCVKGTTDPAYIANPVILKGISKGKIAVFTDDASVTPERLLEKEISLIVFSGFGKDMTNADKLEKIGIVTMANYDWREEHPLGKAEWIKVFGYLIDQPEKAQVYFKEVERSYNRTRQAIVSVSKHPRVLVGSLIGEIWYAPAGKSYMAHILKDAGADYIYSNEAGTGSCEKSLEQVYKDQEQAEFWINPGAVSLADLIGQQGKYALFQPFKTRKVYCYTHSSNYFWEMSAVNPHWILSDFASILATSDRTKLHFYRKLP